MSVYYSCAQFVDVIQSRPQQWFVVFSWVLLFASLTEIKTVDKFLGIMKDLGIMKRSDLSWAYSGMSNHQLEDCEKDEILLSRDPYNGLSHINCVNI